MLVIVIAKAIAIVIVLLKCARFNDGMLPHQSS